MNQYIQIFSCIVDIILIMTILQFIVDDSFRVAKCWAILAVLTCGFGVFFLVGNRYAQFDTTMMVIRLALPLIIYTIFGSGSTLKRCGKYLLALLFFSSAEILSVFVAMLAILDNSNNSLNRLFLSIISIIINLMAIIFIYYICGRKNTKISFSGNEWGLLLLANSITLMLLLAVGYGWQFPFVSVIPQEFLQIVLKYSVIFLYLFFVISLINSKMASHFKEVGQITQENMDQQLEYFKAYQNSQEEIRHYKHDMKNHFLYLGALSKDNKTEEMKEYINSLSGQWESIPSLPSTGNTVVDALIYGKSFLLEQNHISLTIEGQFTSKLMVEPIDLCTIFTNAIDNAIEANVKCLDNKPRYLNIVIKRSPNNYLIIFENPIHSSINITDNHIPTDKQDAGHGFGLKNIERALAKYDGSFKVSSMDNMFKLEVIILK